MCIYVDIYNVCACGHTNIFCTLFIFNKMFLMSLECIRLYKIQFGKLFIKCISQRKFVSV